LVDWLSTFNLKLCVLRTGKLQRFSGSNLSSRQEPAPSVACNDKEELEPRGIKKLGDSAPTLIASVGGDHDWEPLVSIGGQNPLSRRLDLNS